MIATPEITDAMVERGARAIWVVRWGDTPNLESTPGRRCVRLARACIEAALGGGK